MNKEEFDDWFDRAFDESVKNHSFVPDSEESWMKVQRLVEKRNRRKQQLRMLPYVAASFLLGALIFGTPSATNAFEPLYKAYVSVKDGMTRIIFGSMQKSDTVPLTPPPPGFEENSPFGSVDPFSGGQGQAQGQGQGQDLLNKSHPLTEQPEMSFSVPSLTFIPDEYTLYELITNQFPQDIKPSELYYAYMNSEGFILSIRFTHLRPNQTISTGQADENVTVERLTIQGGEAFLFRAEDGWLGLEFLHGDIFVSIHGPVTDTEIVQIAEEIEFKK